tara:strand:- start:58 stop:363 length:306 start_codon:yes stop_codon:yes gene_type:complete
MEFSNIISLEGTATRDFHAAMGRKQFEDKTPHSLYKEKILRVIFVECYVERLLELNLVGQFVTLFVTPQQASTLENKGQRKSPRKARKRKKPQNILCSETS